MRPSASTVLGFAACLALSAGPAAAQGPASRGTLLDALRGAGLQGVRAVPGRGNPGVVSLEGALPGTSGLEIVLTARDEAGVVLAAVEDLRRTPLRHTVRLVLLDGGGSRGWVEGLGPGQSDRILAVLTVEGADRSGSGGPAVQVFPATRPDGESIFPPAWLVHFLLRSGRVVDVPLSVTGGRFPLLAQLVFRSVEVPRETDSSAFLEQGIPAASLSDSSSHLLAAAVRQLDGLAGRPIPEDRYLAVLGRVWPRRDLLWLGFLVWVLLVFRGRPGRWRGTSAEEHGRQMRTYLPGFLFRVLLLLAIFLAPVFSVLLLPAAALALFPPRWGWPRVLWIVLGVLPFLLYLAALGMTFQAGAASGFQGGWEVAVLIPAALLAYGVTIGRQQGMYHPRR
jgi:hypothetical protein